MSEQFKHERGLKSKTMVRLPRMYHVIMYNDDFTPMDFVVEVLMSVFRKKEQEAFRIMYAIHRGTKAVVGTYTYDVATTKADLCIKKARAQGYPFRVKAVPADASDEGEE